jgi:hypothetical protein
MDRRQNIMIRMESLLLVPQLRKIDQIESDIAEAESELSAELGRWLPRLHQALARAERLESVARRAGASGVADKARKAATEIQALLAELAELAPYRAAEAGTAEPPPSQGAEAPAQVEAEAPRHAGPQRGSSAQAAAPGEAEAPRPPLRAVVAEREEEPEAARAPGIAGGGTGATSSADAAARPGPAGGKAQAEAARKERARGGRQFDKDQAEFFAAERAFEAGEDTEVARCHLKALICFGRSLMAKAPLHDRDAGAIEISVGLLGNRLKELGEDRFYGLNPGRDHDAAAWHRAREAYGWLARAYEAKAFLDEHDVAGATRDALLMGVAAVETNLARLMHGALAYAADEQQKRLHAWVQQNQRQGLYIEWWTLEENGGPKDSRVREAAASFCKDVPEVLKRCARQHAIEAAQAAVHGAIDSLEAGAGDADEPDDAGARSLNEAVQAWLQAGGRPTEVQVARRLAPFASRLDRLNGRQAAQLIRHLESLNAEENGTDAEEPNGHEPNGHVPNPEQLRKLERVRRFLEGKTMLFVGGEARYEHRAMLERELGLRSLLWPGSDADTRPAYFEAAANAADVVCLLVRFARHEYQRVMEAAQQAGKWTFKLPAGYGLNRVVHDIYEQLPPEEKEAT